MAPFCTSGTALRRGSTPRPLTTVSILPLLRPSAGSGVPSLNMSTYLKPVLPSRSSSGFTSSESQRGLLQVGALSPDSQQAFGFHRCLGSLPFPSPRVPPQQCEAGVCYAFSLRLCSVVSRLHVGERRECQGLKEFSTCLYFNEPHL